MKAADALVLAVEHLREQIRAFRPEVIPALDPDLRALDLAGYHLKEQHGINKNTLDQVFLTARHLTPEQRAVCQLTYDQIESWHLDDLIQERRTRIQELTQGLTS